MAALFYIVDRNKKLYDAREAEEGKGKDADRDEGYRKALEGLRNLIQGKMLAETGEQDVHQIIMIGAAALVPHQAMADSLMDEISRFVEENCDAEILDEHRELR